MFNYIVAEPVRKHFAGQRRNGNPRAFSFQYVAKVFKIRVSPPYSAVLELEGGDVGAAYYLVIGVHAA